MDVNESMTPPPPEPVTERDAVRELRACPPFDARRLSRQLALDTALWWCLRLTLLMVMVYALAGGAGHGHPALAVFFLIVAGGWLAHSYASARVAQQLPQITELIEGGGTQAESLIATALRRAPLQRSVRLLLYHRLAMLRHRQRNYEESAAIAHTMLRYPLGPVTEIRPHLLLILGESRLLARDFWQTWYALTMLYRCRLNLIERLQVLTLQTRYEVATGQDAAALRDLDRKIALCELMPAPQCGAMHAILAVASRRRHDTALADWLRRRADLICLPEQLADIGV